ncbi:MAG: hypothetical protein ACI857_003438 [Arenicella sp.]
MLDSLGIKIREEFIVDGGPFYNEFHADHLVREPWNAFSSLLFFVPIIFWLVKLKGEYKQNIIILSLLPFLFMNGLGSTLYHAFRSSSVFLYMDFLPASAMSIILSSYLWYRLTDRVYKGVGLVLIFYVAGLLAVFFFTQLEALREMGPNIGYLFVGASYFVPIIIILKKTKFRDLKFVLISVGSLGLALLFRILDYPSENYLSDILPQGTHFLWHTFSVIAVFSMGFYIYKLNKIIILE